MASHSSPHSRYWLSYFYVPASSRIALVDFRNEQAAAYAADAAARLTRRVGVCAVSAAVGHVSALLGVLNAWFDGSPLLLLSGASEHTLTDMGKFQELDHIPWRHRSASTRAWSTAPNEFLSTFERPCPCYHRRPVRSTDGAC